MTTTLRASLLLALSLVVTVASAQPAQQPRQQMVARTTTTYACSASPAGQCHFLLYTSDCKEAAVRNGHPGEAIHGDVPAVAQVDKQAKQRQERQDMLELTAALDAPMRGQLLALWEEYEEARSPEARLAKALDKLETVLQHNQGRNPPGFDYGFNQAYGRHHTAAHPLTAAIRAILDRESRDRMDGVG